MEKFEKEYKTNQIVWGKVSGYPWWPGFIKSKKKNLYEISFFGDFTRSYLKKSKIKKFEEKLIKFKFFSTKLIDSIESARKVNQGISTINEEILKIEKKLEIENNENYDEIKNDEIVNKIEIEEIEEKKKNFEEKKIFEEISKMKIEEDNKTMEESKFLFEKKCDSILEKKNDSILEKDSKISILDKNFNLEKSSKNSILEKLSPKKKFLGKKKKIFLEIKKKDFLEPLLDFKTNETFCTISEFKNFSNTDDLKILENRLKILCMNFSNFDFSCKNDISKFEKIIEEILEKEIFFIYNSKIGKYLNLLFIKAEKIFFENSDFDKIFSILKLGKEKLKNKILTGFYKTENRTIFKFPKKTKKIQKLKKTKKIKNKKKYFFIKNHKISEKTIFKVCRKLTKNFLQNYPHLKNYHEISKKIEEKIRNFSKNFQNYQNNIIEFNKKIVNKKLNFDFFINKAYLDDFDITSCLKEDSVLNN